MRSDRQLTTVSCNSPIVVCTIVATRWREASPDRTVASASCYDVRMSLSCQDAWFRDPDALSEAFRYAGWAAEYDQLSRGAFDGRLVHTRSGSAEVYRGLWTKGLRQVGCQPTGSIVLGVTLDQRGDATRLFGEPISRGDVVVVRGQEGFEIYSSPLWDLAILVLPEDEVLNEIRVLTQRDAGRFLKRRGFARLRPPQIARLERACKTYFSAVEASQDRADGGFPVDFMCGELVSLAVRLVAEAEFEPMPKVCHQRRLEIVRRAREYTDASENEAIRIPDLCRHLGVSERTLRYAFTDVTGASPAAYLRAQRLNRVRRQLRVAEPSETLVKTIAYEHGFYHLGQFSRDYRELFGERPSETLGA